MKAASEFVALPGTVRRRREPDADAAGVSPRGEFLLRFLEQFLPRNTIQRSPRQASPARFSLRGFPLHLHSFAPNLRSSHGRHAALEGG